MPGGGDGQHARDPVVPDEPDDLLDEVVRVGEVAAARSAVDRAAPSPVAVDVAADRGQRRARPSSPSIVDAGRPLPGRSVGMLIGPASARRADDGRRRRDRAAAELDQERGRPGGGGRPIVGSTPRSNRLDASLGSLCRRAVRAIDTGSKCAASSTTSVVAALISVDCAAHHAGQPDRARVVGDEQVLGVERRASTPSSVVRRLARRWPAGRRSRPASRSPS